MLFITAASRCKGMMVYHGMPEKISQFPTVIILRQLVVACFGKNFWDKGIRVLGS